MRWARQRGQALAQRPLQVLQVRNDLLLPDVHQRRQLPGGQWPLVQVPQDRLAQRLAALTRLVAVLWGHSEAPQLQAARWMRAGRITARLWPRSRAYVVGLTRCCGMPLALSARVRQSRVREEF
jgi:hypothetical protein